MAWSGTSTSLAHSSKAIIIPQLRSLPHHHYLPNPASNSRPASPPSWQNRPSLRPTYLKRRLSTCSASRACPAFRSRAADQTTIVIVARIRRRLRTTRQRRSCAASMGHDTDQPIALARLPSVSLCSLSEKPVLTNIANCRPCSRSLY